MMLILMLVKIDEDEIIDSLKFKKNRTPSQRRPYKNRSFYDTKSSICDY